MGAKVAARRRLRPDLCTEGEDYPLSSVSLEFLSDHAWQIIHSLPFFYALRRRGRAVMSSSGDKRVRNSRTKENDEYSSVVWP